MAADGDLITVYGSPLWVVRTLRDRGMRIPRFVWATGEDRASVGRLEIGWTVSDKHRRQMHVATFRMDGDNLLPCIRDVHIVNLSGGNLTLTGFEQVEDREYAQSWYCRLARVNQVARGKPDDPTGTSSD